MKIYGYVITGDPYEIETVVLALSEQDAEDKLHKWVEENWVNCTYWQEPIPEDREKLFSMFFEKNVLSSFEYHPFEQDLDMEIEKKTATPDVTVETYHVEIQIHHDDFTFDAPTYEQLVTELDECIDQFDLWHYDAEQDEFTAEQRVMLAYYDGWIIKYENEDEFKQTIWEQLSEEDKDVYESRFIEYGITYFETNRQITGK